MEVDIIITEPSSQVYRKNCQMKKTIQKTLIISQKIGGININENLAGLNSRN